MLQEPMKSSSIVELFAIRVAMEGFLSSKLKGKEVAKSKGSRPPIPLPPTPPGLIPLEPPKLPMSKICLPLIAHFPSRCYFEECKPYFACRPCTYPIQFPTKIYCYKECGCGLKEYLRGQENKKIKERGLACQEKEKGKNRLGNIVLIIFENRQRNDKLLGKYIMYM